ncbi:bifunctional diguanylate cyclase/phosphodiesterase [Pseudoalteromonas xiamenensis]|uniref:putative bifunctional diguanylate cyclase/phosphodiesterase n=1 Tax=Pseudoalteromonas xiamenensis TaxID=882626 RepID=UPI0027E56B69|nr:bifunctional diguanylate cyclase/phosphodiesterase [Pseudoalteromonas xiamenensis]WMN58865.1 bifunctional diguanylate cyclase/phosphodiesterase [Pseudoalteromonas xiamenensis]
MRSAIWLSSCYVAFILLFGLCFFQLKGSLEENTYLEVDKSLGSYAARLQDRFVHIDHILDATQSHLQSTDKQRDLDLLFDAEHDHFAPLRAIGYFTLDNHGNSQVRYLAGEGAIFPKGIDLQAQTLPNTKLGNSRVITYFNLEGKARWLVIKKPMLQLLADNEFVVAILDASLFLAQAVDGYSDLTNNLVISSVHQTLYFEGDDVFFTSHRRVERQVQLGNGSLILDLATVIRKDANSGWENYTFLALFCFVSFVGWMLVTYIRTLTQQKAIITKAVTNQTEKLKKANKASQEAARLRTEALEQQLIAERKYKSLFMHTQEALIVVDADGVIQEYNPKFAALFLGDMVASEVRLETWMAEDVDIQMWLSIVQNGADVGQWEWLALSQTKGSLWVKLSGQWIKSGDDRFFEGQLSDITDQMLQQSQLKYRAEHDDLTDLWNRSSLLNAINQVCHENEPANHTYALLYLNIDRFRLVNDTLGHDIGDQVLLELSNRLRYQFAANGEIARLGSDEFAVLLPMLNLTEPLEIELESFLIAMARPMLLQFNSLLVSVSMGVRHFKPGTPTSAERLLHEAGFAMEEAKKRGKNGYCEFTPTMAVSKTRRLEIEKALSDRLVFDQFHLVYQPIFARDGIEIKGFEALVRWHSPVLGVVSPTEFIPIAEESGKILALGEWVCKTACEFIEHSNRQDFFVSLNVAPLQLEQPGFYRWFIALMETHGITPSQIKIEVTESALVSADTQMTESLELLIESDIDVYIDDFGTGHSSLARLKSLPATGLKIDKAFVDDMSHCTKAYRLIKTIAAIAENFQLTVTVEGIESESQFRALEPLYHHQLQGFLLGKPVIHTDAIQLIRSQPTCAQERTIEIEPT